MVPQELNAAYQQNRWDPTARVLEVVTAYPVDPDVNSVSMNLTSGSINIQGADSSFKQPQLAEKLTVMAESEDEARFQRDLRELTVTQVTFDGSGSLDVLSHYDQEENTITTIHTRSFGDDRMSTFTSTMSFGEGGGTVIQNADHVELNLGGNGKILVNGQPIEEVNGQQGIIHHEVKREVTLWVPEAFRPVQYDLTTADGDMRVRRAQGDLFTDSRRGSLTVDQFKGRVTANMQGNVTLRNVQLEGHSDLNGTSVGVWVRNTSLGLLAHTERDGIDLLKHGFTSLRTDKRFRRIPNSVQGYFGENPQPDAQLHIRAKSGITVRR